MMTAHAHRPRILITTDYYLPGYLGGGPIRTLSNLVDHLGDVFEFRIVASDRDLGARVPYPEIGPNIWHRVGRASVMYQAKDRRGFAAWRRLVRETEHDLLYLNSLFSRSTMRLLMLRRLGLVPDRPVILAPRGELSLGAMGLKAWRKRVFLVFARLTGLFRDVHWQASTAMERGDIVSALGLPGESGKSTPVSVGVDLPPRQPRLPPRRETAKVPGTARIIFLSRIARNKNLDYALRAVGQTRGRIAFDIYGPREDRAYWEECGDVMRSIPPHVVVKYHGEVDQESVIEVFASYDLLLFPTRSENYGHVVLEALTAGCPVLISDTTPWRSLAEKKAGWDLPLDTPQRFVSTLQQVINMGEAEHVAWRQGARAHALRVGFDTSAVEANRDLFMTVLRGRTPGCKPL